MAKVHPSAQIGNNAVLSQDCIVGPGAKLGNNVTVYPQVKIGDNCTVYDGAVLGRPPQATNNITRQVESTLMPFEIGEGSIIGANAVLYTGVTIGQRTLIGDLASIREGCTLADDVIVGRGTLVMYNTAIGNRTRVIDGAILTGNMTIEEDVFIGPGVNSINDNEVYLKRFGLIPFEALGPTVRRFAVIGAGANLAAKIEVGVGAIVAPNAMVTRDVPGWTIVAGIPAREIQTVSQGDRLRLLAHFGLTMADIEETG